MFPGLLSWKYNISDAQCLDEVNELVVVHKLMKMSTVLSLLL